MFSSVSKVLHKAAEVVAPSLTTLQELEYHWEKIKYQFELTIEQQQQVHVSKTKIPVHLESILEILINTNNSTVSDSNNYTDNEECLSKFLAYHPLDYLLQLSVTDAPIGIRNCSFKWIRRFLSCVKTIPLYISDIYQPIQDFIALCSGKQPSAYEEEEILFLETVAGLIGKTPQLLDLFLASHQYLAIQKFKEYNSSEKPPFKNQLFECKNLDGNIKRIEIVTQDVKNQLENNTCIKKIAIESNDQCLAQNECTVVNRQCDCENGDRFELLEAILSYFESPDFRIVVRACEGALIICSLPTLITECIAIQTSLENFTTILIEKLVNSIKLVPEDIDPSDVEETHVVWGLFPKDDDDVDDELITSNDNNNPYNCNRYFIGKLQLQEFLRWLDYTDCLSRECPSIMTMLSMKFRCNFLFNYLEAALITTDTPFILVLLSKIIKQIKSHHLINEIANWLVGDVDDVERNDSLVRIIIENSQDNPDMLLSALQFVEALLDNPHERILHEIIFRYIDKRGYYDTSFLTTTEAVNVQYKSDESTTTTNPENEIVAKKSAVKSSTLASDNILKVINKFLLLLPRQMMTESGGTCYEEYVQDASRHYMIWIKKTSTFSWPIEAISSQANGSFDKDHSPLSSGTSDSIILLEELSKKSCTSSRNNSNETNQFENEQIEEHNNQKQHSVEQISKDPQCNDSGISEETFYEGPLLRLLFGHVKNMAFNNCEINLAIIAILSKLAFLPHPYLHEILLNPELPLTHGATTLWTSMQELSRYLLIEIPKIENFQQKIRDTGKRLLSNPPILGDESTENDLLFEAIVVLEEFCKELAAIAFVKYHHATE